MTTSGQKKRMSATKKADALFSKIVRSRGFCQMAVLFPAVECRGHHQCAHVIGRAYRRVRWDPDNALCACAAHHMYQTYHPEEFQVALDREYGKAYRESLRDLALNGPKVDPKDAVARLSLVDLQDRGTNVPESHRAVPEHPEQGQNRNNRAAAVDLQDRGQG